MTYAKWIAAAAFAALPFAATAAGSAFEVSIGERGYVFESPPSTLSRAQVLADRNAAPGMISFGERGFRFETKPSTRSRAEVLAELGAAQRLGLTSNGEQDPPFATAAQQARIEQAGETAAMLQAASASNMRR